MKKRFLLPALCGLFMLTSCSDFSIIRTTIVEKEVVEKDVVVTISDEVEVIETKNQISDAYSMASKSCVGIYVTTEEGAASGSGVIYKYDAESKLYYVVTNDHVVGEATEIKIYDGDELYYTATLVGTDSKNDVAVVTFKTEDLGEAREFKALDFMESDTKDITTIGQTVLAIGCPLSLSTYNVLTTGIVSYVSPTQIFTDTALNPGNSGGGLFNIEGRLLGLVNSKTVWTTSSENGVTSQIPVEGRGYAIPLSTVKECINDIETNGSVTRPVLGMTVTNINTLLGGSGYDEYAKYLPEVQDRYSYVVAISFTDTSIAASQGMKVGDVILKVNGNKVTKNTDLTTVLNFMLKGEIIVLTVYRKDTNETLDVSIEYVDAA